MNSSRPASIRRVSLSTLIVMLCLCAWGITNDRRSCEYAQSFQPALTAQAHAYLQAAQRLDSRAKDETGKERSLDQKGAKQDRQNAKNLYIPKLDCTALLPSVPAATKRLAEPPPTVSTEK